MQISPPFLFKPPTASSSLYELTEKQIFAERFEIRAQFCEPERCIFIDELIKRSHCDLRHLEHECLELFMNRAVCLLQLHELGEAKKLLLKLLKYCRSELADNNNGGMDEPDCLFFLAECDYRMGSYKEAEKFYRDALDDYRKCPDPLSTDLSPALGGLAGCLARKKINTKRIDVKNSGADSLRTGWSILNLSDALRHLGKDSEAQPLSKKLVMHSAARIMSVWSVIGSSTKRNQS